AAAGEQRDAHAGFLHELHRQPVADVELLDLVSLARVDDLAVGPDAVDVGHDQFDVARVCHRQCRKWRSPVKTIARPRSFAAAITSASRTEPPGWMIART